MGSFVELNDTLQITTEQGFPADLLDLEKHRQQPISLAAVQDQIFEFQDKPGARIYHTPPTRCFLVHNLGGKWLYWGKCLILEQTIYGADPEHRTTAGKFKIIEIYEPVYQEQITKHESSAGLSLF
ncbi:MAG: hypothetical protein WCT37_02380 [Patescibacteria group bacterium]|jgi:hypothetical protein